MFSIKRNNRKSNQIYFRPNSEQYQAWKNCQIEQICAVPAKKLIIFLCANADIFMCPVCISYYSFAAVAAKNWRSKAHKSVFQRPQPTMLQKFSKCKFKAWLCWNLIILPPLRFCMKSHFGEFKRSKNVIHDNFRDAELWILVNLWLESCSDLPKFNVQHLWNCHKWHFWTV